MPERLGTSYRCRQLLDGPIRVAEHPGDQRREELALHGGVSPRPIRELHVRLEDLGAAPKLCKRRLELPLLEQRRAERHVPADEAGRIAKPFGHVQRLLSKMQRLLHLE
jgi:hypothetical protein